MREKIKSVGFWSAVAGAIVLLLGAFGVEIGDETASAAVNALCTVLMLFGVISSPNAVGPTETTGEQEQVKDSDDASQKQTDNDKGGGES